MAGKIAAAVVLLCASALAAEPAAPKEKPEPFVTPRAVQLDRDGEKWAEKTLKHMSLEEKVGQMFLPWARVEFVNVNSPEYERLRDMIRTYHVGGFGVTVNTWGGMVLRSEPLEAAALMNQLQRDSATPLIFAADFERGVAMRFAGSTLFPYAMAFGAVGDPTLAETFGRITAEEARAIGVTWNWFPVADVNSNPQNPIINTRAFGEDPRLVGELASAYVRGAHAGGMLTTAKHFPGHGDTATDSHLGMAMVGGDLQRLQTVELPPFQKAIDSGVDSVMVAHVTVPALDPTPNAVATTSRPIVTDLLKGKMGFKGLVVTDALDMGGLMRLYTGQGGNPSALAAVAAVKAGNDVLIIPADLDAAWHGVIDAVRRGEIPEQRIDESVLKILKAKASVGLNKAKLVDLDAVNRRVADPKALTAAQDVADRAVTLVKDTGSLLPLRTLAPEPGTNGSVSPYGRIVEKRNRVVAIIFTDDVRSENGRAFERQLRARVPDANVIWIDPNNAAFSTEPVLATVDNAQAVIAAVYSVPVSGKRVRVGNELTNTVGMQGGPAGLLQKILERAAAKTALVALGSPYLASDFPAAQVVMCTYSNVPVSEASAVRALFGEIGIAGKLPVSIPQVAPRGFGISRAPVAGGTNGQKTVAGPR